MAVKRKTRRKLRRTSPAVRRAPDSALNTAQSDAKSSALLVGGAHDPAEKTADQLAAKALGLDATVGARAAAAPSGTLMRETAPSPTLAPGATHASAPQAAADAVKGLGAGRALSAAERGYFEPRFGKNFSSVRVHEGASVDRANAALGARAFARDNDIAFSSGERTRETLAHELAHVVLGSGDLRRDLAIRAPGRAADPPDMDEGERASAASFNNATFNQHNTKQLLDILGQAGRPAFTADNVQEVRNWQADFRLPPDGKIGKRTLEPLGREMIAKHYRTRAIKLIVDGHNFSLTNVSKLFYDRSYTANNALTEAPRWGAKSEIKIGKPGVDQGYRGLVHTIAHEIDHANVFRGGAVPEPRFEFQGECVEIISSGMLRESVSGLMSDAQRAWNKWTGMTTADKQAMWAKFQQARDTITHRYDRLSAARKAPHTALVNHWRGQGAP
jgi:hypothetical protein